MLVTHTQAHPSHTHSAEQVETRQKNTARKRRRNQNSEIDELAALLPIKQPSTLGNGVVARGRNQSIDKISVLRLTSAYLKFQKYMEKDQQKGVCVCVCVGGGGGGVHACLCSRISGNGWTDGEWGGGVDCWKV